MNVSVVFTDKGVVIGHTVECLNPAFLTVKGAIYVTQIEKEQPKFFLPPLLEKGNSLSIPYNIIHIIGTLDKESTVYTRYLEMFDNSSNVETKVEAQTTKAGKKGAQIVNLSPKVVK